ncbi:MAG: Stp1/IreP family PP2C-type Ser/Thr phosphatase [Elusimicrobiota bacterium]
MGYSIKISGKTDKGMKRSKNEDCMLIDEDLGLMIVADGMGGHASGEVASQLATSISSEQLKRSLQTGHVPVFFHVPKNPQLDPRTIILGDCIKLANSVVNEAAQKTAENHNMGTTIVVALCLENKLSIGHVGDSRLYVIRQGKKIKQITVDHSFVQEQVDKGLLKAEDAEKSDMRNMLTRSVGISADVDVDLNEIELSQGDYILLCSDGLSKMLDDTQIENVFYTKTEPQEIVDQLIDLANQSGGLDNVTAIVGLIKEESSAWGNLTERLKKILRSKPKRN